MKTATQKVSKSEVVRQLLANPKLSVKQIAKKAKATHELVYAVRHNEKRKKLLAATNKVIPSVAQAKFKDGTPLPTVSVKPKAKQTIETKMKAIDDNQRIDTLDFILNNNLNYNLGRAVDLIVNADKSQDREKDLLLAVRHLAIDVARSRHSK
jgi:hypothetical protein